MVKPPADTYVRAVQVLAVTDGDTFKCDVDLGFYVRVRMLCRLTGLNANESNEPGGPEARAALAALLAAGPVTVRSVQPDKYAGRFDAYVHAGGVAVNQALIDGGLAVPWDGTGPRPKVPWPPPVPAPGG